MRPTPVLLALLLSLTACGPAEAPSDAPAPPAADAPAAEVPAEAAPEGMINLNTATSEEFATIPGVGERMIGEFEEYRPYASISQFRREIGKYVDEEQVAAYEAYVFVPVDRNESDAETLQQLPGVGAGEADSLIARRPFASDDAFLDAYTEVVPSGDAAAVRGYLAQ